MQLLTDQRKTVRLIACPTIAYEHGKIDRYVPEGATVAAHLRAIGWKPEGLNARVFIDGEFIEQARWEYAVPRAGQSFVTRAIPMGGAGGGKDALRIVSMLAIVALAIFAPYLAPSSWGLVSGAFVNGVFTFSASALGSLASAAITIAGSLAITARMPPARPRLRDQRQVPHG